MGVALDAPGLAGVRLTAGGGDLAVDGEAGEILLVVFGVGGGAGGEGEVERQAGGRRVGSVTGIDNQRAKGRHQETPRYREETADRECAVCTPWQWLLPRALDQPSAAFHNERR